MLISDFHSEKEITVSGKVNRLITCPACGATNSRSKLHCSIVMDTKPYIKCFVCGYFYSFVTKESFNNDGAYKVPKRKTDVAWLPHAQEYLANYISNEYRYNYWHNYKQLTPAIVDKYKLGVGQLPLQKHMRLITPLFYNDEFLTFRGRAIDDHIQPKWIFAKGGTAPSEFNLLLSDQCPKKSIVLIVENYIDAIKFNELNITVDGTRLYALPTLSTNNWFDLWTNDLTALVPQMVAVCFDNDFAGNGLPQDSLAPALTKRIANKENLDPELISIQDIVLYQDEYTIYYKYYGVSKIAKLLAPAGIRLNNKLVANGFNSHLFDWSKVTAIGKDLGDIL